MFCCDHSSTAIHSGDRQFGAEIAPVLRPGSHVMLWCDKSILCQGFALEFFQSTLKFVDLLTSDKGKIGMDVIMP